MTIIETLFCSTLDKKKNYFLPFYDSFILTTLMFIHLTRSRYQCAIYLRHTRDLYVRPMRDSF